MAKSRRLFLLHLPGPIHGSSIVGKNYQKYIVNAHDLVFPIQLAQDKSDIAKFSLRKLAKAAIQLYKVFLLSFKVDKFILFYTSNGLLLYRDILLRTILWRKKGYLVMHNKGINNVNTPSVLLRMFFKNCKVLILSKSLFFDINKYVKFENTHIIPNCLFEESKRPRVNKDYSTLKFLFLSNLVRSKGVMEAIELVKSLSNSGLKVQLDIVGMAMNVSIDEIQKSIYGFEGVITYHGPQYGDSKDQFLADCNILIFPTRYPQECFPLVIIEAFAHSMPVISLDNGAIGDIIDNDLNGYVFHQSVSDKAIEDWILTKTEYEWNDMSTRAYAEYINSYQLERWIYNTKSALQ